MRAAGRLRELARQAEAARDEAQARAHVLQQRLELVEAGSGPQGSGLGYVRQAAAAREEAELRARVLQQRLDLAEEAAAAKPGRPGLAYGLGDQQQAPLAPHVSPATAPRPPFDARACVLAGTPPAMPDACESAEEPLPTVLVASIGPAGAGAHEAALHSMPAGSAACPPSSGRSATRLARQGGGLGLCSGGNPLRSPTLGSLEVLVAGTAAMVAQTLAADAGLASGRRTPRREGAHFAVGSVAGGPLPGPCGRDADAENTGSLRPVAQNRTKLAGRSDAAPATRSAAPGRTTPEDPAYGQAESARSPLAEVSPQRQVPLAAGAGAPPPTKAAPPRGRRNSAKLSPKPGTPSPGLAARMRAGLFGGSRGRTAAASPGATGAGGSAGHGGACLGAPAEVDASLCLHGSPMSPLTAERIGGLREAAATSKGKFLVFASTDSYQHSRSQRRHAEMHQPATYWRFRADRAMQCTSMSQTGRQCSSHTHYHWD